MFGKRDDLYIPIWFYFNSRCLCCYRTLFSLYIPIWFYFNELPDILICPINYLYIPIWFYFNEMSLPHFVKNVFFTFQYGSTLIHTLQAEKGVFFPFTFQYGSTLISKETWPHEQLTQLYIPIWFYFNGVCRRWRCAENELYIPIWFYFNEFKQRFPVRVKSFTFQYGSTLIFYDLEWSQQRNLFTFQYGSTLI